MFSRHRTTRALSCMSRPFGFLSQSPGSRSRALRTPLLEHVQSALHLASGVLVAAAGSHFDALQIHLAGLIEPAHAFQGLATVKVGRGVVRIGGHEGTEFAHGGLQVSGIAILHRQTVARETVGGVLFHHALQRVQTGTCHACVTIPCKMACPYFYPVEARAGSAMLPLGEWWTGLSLIHISEPTR